MNKMRFYISLIFAKVVFFILKITKLSSGTSIIGKYVLKICPDFLSICNKYIKTKINVTGTNGKTTTSGLITKIIEGNNYTVLNNSMGANLLNGVVNALAVSLDPSKTTDFSVIETDEAYLSVIYNHYEADYLIVTNLFRDQLDRYGELATTKKYIQDGIDKKSELTLILNADDPLVATFEGKKKIFYGVEDVKYADGVNSEQSQTEEAFTCKCGQPLSYEKKFFAQQGHYSCKCGFERPKPKYNASVVVFKDHSEISINGETYSIPLVGLFNAYNAIASIALAKELGLQNIQNALNSFHVAFGRSEIKYLNGMPVLIQLIKNPVGANEVLKTVDLNSQILIIINDNYADGRDVSWLWDAEFERLQGATLPIIVSGIRAEDMALRLKYAGIENVKISKNIPQAVKDAGEAQTKITILPTYTALLSLNKNKNLKKEN